VADFLSCEDAFFIQGSEDDIPEFAINKKPLKIETSFGDGRIGEVFDGGSSE
jgi:hypothetical protein